MPEPEWDNRLCHDPSERPGADPLRNRYCGCDLYLQTAHPRIQFPPCGCQRGLFPGRGRDRPSPGSHEDHQLRLAATRRKSAGGSSMVEFAAVTVVFVLVL